MQTHLLIRLFWAVAPWLLGCGAAAQANGQSPANGIKFWAGSYQQALQRAQQIQKPLFVKVYLTGCPHCEALAPVLTERPVGDFFNERFVSWQVEANHAESKALQQQLDITYPEFPLLLFISPQGKLMHLATPAEQPTRAGFVREVLQHGQAALEPTQRASSYTQRFSAGERALGFLLQAGKYWTATHDSAQLRVLNDSFSQILTQPQEIMSPEGLYVLNRYTDDFGGALARFFFTHLPAFTQKFGAKPVQEAGEALLYRSLYGPLASRWSAADIARMQTAMIGLGVSPAQAAARLLTPELEALLREQQTAQALERVTSFCRQTSGVAPGYYAFFMRLFNQKASGTAYLPYVTQWAAEGLSRLAQKPDSALSAAIYYELALAQQKLGQREKALASARKGLVLVQSSQTERKPFEQLLASLQ